MAGRGRSWQPCRASGESSRGTDTSRGPRYTSPSVSILDLPWPVRDGLPVDPRWRVHPPEVEDRGNLEPAVAAPDVTPRERAPPALDGRWPVEDDGAEDPHPLALPVEQENAVREGEVAPDDASDGEADRGRAVALRDGRVRHAERAAVELGAGNRRVGRPVLGPGHAVVGRGAVEDRVRGEVEGAPRRRED